MNRVCLAGHLSFLSLDVASAALFTCSRLADSLIILSLSRELPCSIKLLGSPFFFRQQEFYRSETNMPMDGLIAALDYISGREILYTRLSRRAAENGKNSISMRNRANYCCY
jgi:hypothetical protein